MFCETGSGNGFTGTWSGATSPITTSGDSLILHYPFTISVYKRYRFVFDATLCPGATLVIVAYKSYSGTDSTDFDVLASYTDSGVQTLDFIATENYIRIGFYIEGGCGGEDTSSLDYFRGYTYEGEENLALTLKSADGSSFGMDAYADVNYYYDFITVSIDWRAAARPDGCYTLCITSGVDLNLFVAGDYGGFEAEGSEGNMYTEAANPTRTDAKAYGGTYSLDIGMSSDMPEQVLARNIIPMVLQPDTTYRASAWVYSNSGGDVPSTISILPEVPEATIISNTDMHPQDDSGQWIEIECLFTTADVVDECYVKIICTPEETTTDPLTMFDFYIDNISLVEIVEYCSPRIHLAAEHDCTLLFTYRSDYEAFGITYPEGFALSLRLRAWLSRPKYPFELEQQQYSDGSRSVLYAASRKVYQLNVSDIPEYMHDACAWPCCTMT